MRGRTARGRGRDGERERSSGQPARRDDSGTNEAGASGHGVLPNCGISERSAARARRRPSAPSTSASMASAARAGSHRQAELRERHPRHACGHDHRVAGPLEFRQRNERHERGGDGQVLHCGTRRGRGSASEDGGTVRMTSDNSVMDAASASGQASHASKRRRRSAARRRARAPRRRRQRWRGRWTVAALRWRWRLAIRQDGASSWEAGSHDRHFRRGGASGAVDGIEIQRAGQQCPGAVTDASARC